MAISRILVPLDGSQLAEQALGIAREIAAATGAGIILVRVVPSRPSALARTGAGNRGSA